MNDQLENSNRKYRYHNTPMSVVNEKRLENAIVKVSFDTHFEAINAEIDAVNKQWMKELLLEILDKLTERQRLVLILCEGHSLTIRDAAVRLACSKSTVQRDLRFALQFADEYIKSN